MDIGSSPNISERSAVPVERPKVARGLAAASVLAWVLLVPIPAIADMASARWWEPWWRPPIIWPAFLDAYAIVGLPVACVFCFAVGIPAWVVASRLGLRRRSDAALIGALAGLVLDLVLLGLVGVRYEPPPHHELFTQVLFLPQTIALYVVAVGAAAGLAARWASGIRSVGRADISRLFA